MCLCRRHCAEESEGADKDEEVPAAGGAGVPHGSDGHSDAARGAGEELSGGRGRLQENHREDRHTGLMMGTLKRRRIGELAPLGQTGDPPHLYKAHVTTEETRIHCGGVGGQTAGGDGAFPADVDTVEECAAGGL